MSRIRVAQLGVAAIHAPRYRDTLLYLHDEFELVGLYDPDPDSAAVQASVSAEAAGIPFYATIAELLAEAQPELVMVSGFSRDMPGWLLQSAEAGVHCWIDKPFAVHSSQLLPVKAVIERNQLVFSCGYSWRFDPVSLLIRQTIDDGLLGRGFLVEIRYWGGNILHADLDHWRFDPALSGGGMLNWLGCHWVDLMRYWTGSDVIDVTAIEANLNQRPVTVEDTALVSLRFANGMLGSLSIGSVLPAGTEFSIRVVGSRGAVVWNPAEGVCTITSHDTRWEAAPVRTFTFPPASLPGYGGHGVNLLRPLARAIRGQGTSGFTIDDAIASLQIIEAAHASAISGTRIKPGSD